MCTLSLFPSWFVSKKFPWSYAFARNTMRKRLLLGSAYFWGAPTYRAFVSLCKKRHLLSGGAYYRGALSFGTLRYFRDNFDNVNKFWKGIRSIISTKPSNTYIPTCLDINNSIITNPNDISNSFNDYFSSIAENIKKTIYTNFK